jgi:hypothetical protein
MITEELGPPHTRLHREVMIIHQQNKTVSYQEEPPLGTKDKEGYCYLVGEYRDNLLIFRLLYFRIVRQDVLSLVQYIILFLWPFVFGLIFDSVLNFGIWDLNIFV